jgi:hypothetical protein
LIEKTIFWIKCDRTLKSHSKNIKIIEDNIDAVKSDVITPIKTELVQNKTAGKFSIAGFYVGIIALIITAISLLYTTFKGPEHIKLDIPSDSLNTKDNYSSYSDAITYIINSLNEINYHIHGFNLPDLIKLFVLK